MTLHSAGLVHGLLRPSSVLWLPRRHAWTLVTYTCVSRIGMCSNINGTVECAPQEFAAAVATGATVLADPAHDAWALGLLAYQLLAGCFYKDDTRGYESLVRSLQGPMLVFVSPPSAV